MNISNDSLSQLDALDYGELLRQVQADLKRLDNRFSIGLADTLDTLFTVKFVRLMRTPLVPREALLDLDGLIARICRDIYRSQLNAFPAHYAARWQMLRDAIAAYLRIEDVHAEERLEDTGSRDPWELVAAMVLVDGGEVTWSGVKKMLTQHGVGPQSGGGVSQLLSVMRAHGWIDAVQLRGNKSVLVAGRNIAESQAWRSTHAATAPQPDANVPALAVPVQSQRASHRLTELVLRGTLFNQGALLEFSLVSHELHRTVRLTLQEFDAAGKHGTARRNRLFDAMHDMNRTLNRQTQRVAQQNFELLHQHFRDRHPVAPRMSLMLCQSDPDSDIFTYAYARDGGAQQGCEASRITDNSGFEHVAARGAYYLNNDIPASTLEGNYRNPRFDPAFLRKLREEQPGGVSLNDWLSIWKDGESSDARSHYKSTLIVPLALRTENLSKEFKLLLEERLSGHFRHAKWASASQLILGFLCLDHGSTNYFDAEADVALAHIFAGQLSMYVFNRIMLTDCSVTYHRCLEECDDVQRRKLQAALLSCAEGEASPRDASPPYFDLGATTPSEIFTVSKPAGLITGPRHRSGS